MDENTKKIIVADDHETSVMYISILLKRMGYQVIAAGNGREVLSLLESVSPDVVILDGHMPFMNGLETLKAIKDDPKLKHLPVVMATAHYNEKSHEEYRAEGCAGYLTKPVDLMKLSRIIEESLASVARSQRRNLRIALDQKVQVHAGAETRDFYALTLSEGGTYLRARDPLPVGTEIEISMTLSEQSLRLKGLVIYHKARLPGVFKMEPGMAIEFREVTAQSAAFLKGVIADRLAGDLIEEQDEEVLTIEGQADH